MATADKVEEPLVTVSHRITKQQAHALTAIAGLTGESKSELVREAIDHLIKAKTDPEEIEKHIEAWIAQRQAVAEQLRKDLQISPTP